MGELRASPLIALETAMFRVARRLARAPRPAAGAPEAPDRAALGVLWVLAEAGESRLSDVAARLCLDPSTVSRQVRQLTDAGFVGRASDPDDGRAWRLDLTAAGRRVLADAQAGRRAALQAALTGWSATDRTALIDLLTRLADDLEGLADSPPAPLTAEKSA